MNKASYLHLGAVILLIVSSTLIFLREESGLKWFVLDGLAKILFKQKVVYYKGPFLRKELGEVEKVRGIYYGDKQEKAQGFLELYLILCKFFLKP
jgi:hypothetical protein